MGNFEDLTNQKFNHLTVKYRGESDKSGHARWWCECDCSNPELVLVQASHLKSGHTSSCGCVNLRKKIERISKYNESKKGNKYDLSNNYGIGYDCNNNEFYFDLEDYNLINKYTWNIYFDKNGYADVRSRDINNNTIRMSRLVMNCPKNKVVDHIHCSKTREDNRKSNLRITDNLHNSYNSGIQTNNKSGVTGVCWNKQSQKWLAFITCNKKRIKLGLFDENNFQDAVSARKEAEEKYFGEYSYDNSQNKQD